MKSYVGVALDEIARRRTRRARHAARNADLLQRRAAEVVQLHREKPYPESPLASRAVESEEVEGHEKP